MTQSSNVALLTCASPIFIVLISWLFFKKREKINPFFWHGSVLALVGIALIVFNGATALQINPLGDALSLFIALSWAFYTILLKRMSERYSILFLTRKVFFYGILTLLPFFIFRPLNLDIEILSQPIVWGNLLYLGIVASLMCFFLWSVVVKHLGAVRATNYVYFSPMVTMVAGAIVLGEVITFVAIIGAVLLLIGVALTERVKKQKK
jgi:drug/metabolite transporter (DMT)-like permease